ncbi:serine hydrolase domain-containing protein [Oscillospiraceae bacterium PP1C4]
MRKKLKKHFAIYTMLLLMIMNGLSVYGAEVDRGTMPSGIPIAALEENIDQLMQPYIGASIQGAAVSVAKDNEVVFSKGYGCGDLEKERPIIPNETVFEWGSITKTFTWTAVMQLAEAGKIDLNAAISEYLPEQFLNLQYDEPLTMLHLMNHTAGFEDSGLDLFGYQDKPPVELEIFMKDNQPKQIYKPGTVMAYSNYGTALAGLIVERVAGEKWYDYVEEHIFDPLQMTQTTALANFSNRPELKLQKSKGFFIMGEMVEPTPSLEYIPLYPAGCINGTIEDLMKYGRAFIPNEGEKSPLFEQAETLSELFTYTYKPDASTMGNAHGFWELAAKEKTISHGGGTSSITAQLVIAPEEKVVITIITNSPMGTELCDKLIFLLLNKKELTKQAEGLPATKAVEGNFVDARRNETTFAKFMAAISKVKVTATDETQITLKSLTGTSVYEQVQPYVYQYVEGTNGEFRCYFPIIQFKMVGEEAVAFQSGFIRDYVKAPLLFQSGVGLLSPILALTCIGFFIGAPLYLVIRLLVKKIRKKEVCKLKGIGAYAIHAVLVIGTLSVWNSIILIGRYYISFMSLEKQSANLHILANQALCGIGIIMAILATRMLVKGNKTKKEKWFYCVTLGCFVILSLLQGIWNFI